MRTINEIASWYKKNNSLAKDDLLRIKVLSIYTLVAYKIKNIQVSYEEIVYNGKEFNLGITSCEEDSTFDETETKILNTINRVYGYVRLDYLFSELSYAGITINEICESLKESITNDLEMYENHDFHEHAIVTNNLVFFVNDHTNLTNEEIELLMNQKPYDDQVIFTVYRDEENGKLVVY